MEEEFLRYVNNYDINDDMIKRKYEHSLKVSKINEKYARLLNFNEHDIYLAKIIGLLHDFGRFEQVKVYHSFNDLKTIDHADYSVKILFDEGYINNFNVKEEDKEIIKFAIKNHNKRVIEETDNEDFLKQAKLIRDSDKIDIYRVLTNCNKEQTGEIKEEVLKAFYNKEQIDRKYVETNNENIILNFAFIFDLNYDCAIKDSKACLDIYYESLSDKEMFKDAYEFACKYIKERIEC